MVLRTNSIGMVVQKRALNANTLNEKLKADYKTKSKLKLAPNGNSFKPTYATAPVPLPTVTISNASTSVLNGSYVRRTIDGQIRYGQTDYGFQDTRYIFFDTSTSKWSFVTASTIYATLPISITESDGFWTAGVNDWTGTLGSALQGATYTTSNL